MQSSTKTNMPGLQLLSSLPLPCWLLDTNNLQVIFSNRAADTQHAFPLHSIFTDFLDRHYPTDFFQQLHSASEFRTAVSLMKADGTYASALVQVTVVEMEGKQWYQATVLQQAAHADAQGLLATLVEQTSDMLTAADLEYRPLTWNKAAESIFGLTAEQVIGKNPRTFLDIRYLNLSRDEVRQQIQDKGEWRGEATFMRMTDQRQVTIIIGFKVMCDAAGQKLGYLISAVDISERKEAESRLRESENRFRDMADSLPAMIWMADENNNSTYYNTAWMAFTNVEVQGGMKSWLDLVHPDDRARTQDQFERAFSECRGITLVYRLRRGNGEYAWVHDISTPRFLQDKTFVGFIGTVLDIEEEKQKQESLVYHATILENVSDIIIATDLEFRVKSWNRIAEHLYDVSEASVLNKKITELVAFTVQESTTQEIVAAVETRGMWKGEITTIQHEETRWFHYTITFVNNEHEERIGYLFVARDITDRKRADMKVLQSEQFYRALIADSLDGMILTDRDGTITFASPSVRHVLNFEAPDIEGLNAFSFVHPEDLAMAADSFQREVVANPEVKFISVRLRKKDGEWIWCMVRGHNLLDHPFVKSLVIYFHDDTLRKKANQALKESEKRFRTLIRDLQIGVIVQDKQGGTILCNDAFAAIFGYGKQELEGRNIQNIAIDPIHEDGTQFEPWERPTYKAIQTKRPEKDVVMGIFRPHKKDRVWIMINIDPVLDEQGEIMHIICSVKDITDRKKTEEDQMSRQLTHQRQLTQASIDGQENERREIGKELHDNIGQQLTTIKLFLDMANTTADDKSQEMLNMALKGVSDVINEVRAMSRSLVPSTLKDLGLVESIQELVDSIKRTQLLRIEFEYLDFEEDDLPENLKVTLFRIVQEQLNNIVKHAEAGMVWIYLGTRHNSLYLTIRDNGNGFDMGSIRKGLGFMNIKNRAELFDGRAEIFSRPGEGCTVQVTLPSQVTEAAL